MFLIGLDYSLFPINVCNMTKWRRSGDQIEDSNSSLFFCLSCRRIDLGTHRVHLREMAVFVWGFFSLSRQDSEGDEWSALSRKCLAGSLSLITWKCKTGRHQLGPFPFPNARHTKNKNKIEKKSWYTTGNVSSIWMLPDRRTTGFLYKIPLSMEKWIGS